VPFELKIPPPWRSQGWKVPYQVIDWVRQNIEVFRSNWDRMYPENPLASRRPDCEDDESQEK